MFENKKIFILGMARSGYHAARVLAKMNNEIVINDKNDKQDENHIKELQDLGVKTVLGSHPDDILDSSFDYLIKNPGVPFDHKYLKFCEVNNIKIINEIEMAYHLLPKGVKLVAITGTNGKTTTTTLTYEIVNEFFHGRTHLAGNIGFPLCEVIENIKENDYLVMEIGVPQLHDFYDFNPDIAVLTNIFEAHLDMFGTREYYNENKVRMFQNHTKDNIAIINRDNEDAYRITKDIKSTKKYFSSKKKIDGCYLKNNKIYYYNEEIIDTSLVKLQGVHNFENIMCAIMISKELGIPNDVIRSVVNDFSGVEHRIEYVRTLNGKDFYNDSKATNIKATQTAVSAFKKPTILILGGLERGQSFLDLKDYLGYTKLVVCFGECKNRIEAEMKDLNIKTIVVDTLKDAVNVSNKESESGDVILLSPASASWDQYKCFEDRGDEFKEIVKKL
ncbi:MAG: UDP-N-acetylmuramoyl-L-alanine--D-glutamate ligase [Tenericutes bacterium]|nr:UDP-N-acetylmuramoyl-L-alanine--D-glutamate ligase [Mycoplasmatota bacterium]